MSALAVTFVDHAPGYGGGLYGRWLYGSGVNFYGTPTARMNATLSEDIMPTPHTTIDSSATVKDQNGTLLSNLSAYTLTVTFQDGTSLTPSVINEGSGVYTATYNTTGPGTLTELWSFTDTLGDIAQEQRTLIIAY